MNWEYSKNHDNTVRYTLGNDMNNPLLCFGINPSTASPEKLDNTVSSVKRIVDRHDFSGFIMLNMYPQRSTDPNNMHLEIDIDIHKNNMSEIERIISHIENKNKVVHILAAWGTLINKRKYLKGILEDIVNITNKYNVNWQCIGSISKDGHPHHPLYLSNNEMLKDFDIRKYLIELK